VGGGGCVKESKTHHDPAKKGRATAVNAQGPSTPRESRVGEASFGEEKHIKQYTDNDVHGCWRPKEARRRGKEGPTLGERKKSSVLRRRRGAWVRGVSIKGEKRGRWGQNTNSGFPSPSFPKRGFHLAGGGKKKGWDVKLGRSWHTPRGSLVSGGGKKREGEGGRKKITWNRGGQRKKDVRRFRRSEAGSYTNGKQDEGNREACAQKESEASN